MYKLLLCEQFIHLTQITLHPNIQFLSNQQRAYHSFLVTSWFDSVCITMTCWANFKENHLQKHEQQLSDYNIRKNIAQMYKFLAEKIQFPILLKFFIVKIQNVKMPEIHTFESKYFLIL